MLRFGTAGAPLSTVPRSLENAFARLSELGLGGMELEFVRSINISASKAPLVCTLARQHDLMLTCHGQYFINLFSLDPKITSASMQRVVDAAARAYECGAVSMCFHAAFYQKRDPALVYDAVKQRLRSIVGILRDRSIPIMVRPETTGKASQFGSFIELCRLSSEVEQVMPCVDFSHIHAREGKYNSEKEFCVVLETIERYLGRGGLDNMHIHVSGIEYSEKGERYHLNLEESDLEWKDLLRVLRTYRVKGIVISESPSIEGDALLMQQYYGSI